MKKKLLAGAAVAALAVIAMGAPAQAAPPPQAAQNHEAHWEAMGYGDCTKVEMPDGVGSYTLPPISAPATYTLLVLKAGSGSSASEMILWPMAGVAYDHSTDKDLSHIIYCVGEKLS